MDRETANKVRSTVEASLERISGHRFIEEAQTGRLSEPQCIRWVMCAGRESATFPDLIRGMIQTAEVPTVVNILRSNLADELGNGNPEHAHFRHYLHLLAKLGFSEVDFGLYAEKAGVRLALDLAYAVANNTDPGFALGYMLVNEGMTPITYGAMDTALHKHFPDLRTEFFRLHVEVDDIHVAQLYEALEALPESAYRSVLFGVEVGERGMAVLLDEALGIFNYGSSWDLLRAA